MPWREALRNSARKRASLHSWQLLCGFPQCFTTPTMHFFVSILTVTCGAPCAVTSCGRRTARANSTILHPCATDLCAAWHCLTHAAAAFKHCSCTILRPKSAHTQCAHDAWRAHHSAAKDSTSEPLDAAGRLDAAEQQVEQPEQRQEASNAVAHPAAAAELAAKAHALDVEHREARDRKARVDGD